MCTTQELIILGVLLVAVFVGFMVWIHKSKPLQERFHARHKANAPQIPAYQQLVCHDQSTMMPSFAPPIKSQPKTVMIDDIEYVVQNPQDVLDMYNVDALMPDYSKNDNKIFNTDHLQPRDIHNRNLMNHTDQVGLNTRGNSRKNACLDIRGELPVPVASVAPTWGASSFMFDQDRILNRGLFQQE